MIFPLASAHISTMHVLVERTLWVTIMRTSIEYMIVLGIWTVMDSCLTHSLGAAQHINYERKHCLVPVPVFLSSNHHPSTRPKLTSANHWQVRQVPRAAIP